MRTGVIVMVLALAVAGCSEQLEKVPEQMGGLPADAPGRPKTHYDYPAVHDIPPPRQVKPLEGADLLRLENDLKAARDKQQKAAGQAPETSTPTTTPPTTTGNPQKP